MATNSTQSNTSTDTLSYGNVVAVIIAFVAAFIAYNVGNYVWERYKSPRMQIFVKKVECNGNLNACFYDLAVRNVGRTICNRVRIWVKLYGEKSGKQYGYTAKWTSTPEPYGSYETITQGRNPQMQSLFIRAKNLIPSLLADSTQNIDLPSMPIESNDTEGEKATILYWDQPTKSFPDEKGDEVIMDSGLKIFSTLEYYLLRFERNRTMSQEVYKGHIYLFGDDYSGVCEIKIGNWGNGTPDDLIIKLTKTRVKGCKSISVFNE